jgi:hypothetical protein
VPRTAHRICEAADNTRFPPILVTFRNFVVSPPIYRLQVLPLLSFFISAASHLGITPRPAQVIALITWVISIGQPEIGEAIVYCDADALLHHCSLRFYAFKKEHPFNVRIP